MGGNRVGKTEGVGAYELALHLTGRYPHWWNGRRFKNVGGRATGPVSARLYFSKQLTQMPPGTAPGAIGQWQPTASDEAKFPYAFYGSAGPFGVEINPQETWNWPGFAGQLSQAPAKPISGKVKVFYGSAKPVEAHFVFRKQDGG